VVGFKNHPFRVAESLISGGNGVGEQSVGWGLSEEDRLPERFQSIFQHAVTGMSLHHLDGRFLHVNPAFCQLLGRSEKELLTLSLFDVVHPTDFELVRGRNDIRASGEPASGQLEMRFVHADGHTIWTRAMDAPVVDGGGEILYTLLQVLDLSEQRRLEETTSRLYALSSDLFCTLGFDGYFKTVNPAWQHVLGYTAEQLLMRPMLDFVHPEDRARTARESGRLKRADEVTISFESRFRTKDGAYRWLLWSAHVSPDERLVYGVAKDVTERKRGEERLRESERKYRDLVETSSDLIWSLDAQGRFTFVNRAVRRIYGYEPEEMLGRPVTDFALPADGKRNRGLFRQILRGRPVFSNETEHVRKDGSLVRLSYNAIVLHDAEGNVLGATGTATDVTERRRAEARQAAVAELGRRALEGTDPTALSQSAVTLVAETLGAEFSSVMEFVPEENVLKLEACFGWPDESMGRRFSTSPTASLASFTFHSGGVGVVEDFAEERRFEHPPAFEILGAVSAVCVAIEGTERPFGVLCVASAQRRTFGLDEVNFMQSMANVLATAIDRKRSETQLDQLAATRGRLVAQTLAAEDRARRAISEVLHDHALQDLLASRQDLVEVLEDPEGDPERVVRAREGIERAVRLLRDAVFNLHPVVLEHAGLAAAIRAVADHQGRRGGFECDIEVDRQATGVHDELILSLARELLTNAAKHAQARHVRVRVRRQDKEIALEVSDDGLGMDKRRRARALSEGHIGLASSAERVEAVCGSFELDSRPGYGTTVIARLPARRVAAHRADVPRQRVAQISEYPLAGGR
jgi:PAS domain S-box-containing protein